MSRHSIKRNFAYQMAYQVLILLLPFLTSPYIARVLGAPALGAYSYTYSIVFYFGLFANLGIINYGNRCIAQVRDNRQALNETFSQILYLHMLLTLAVTGLYVLYLWLFPGEFTVIAGIEVLYLVAIFFDVTWLFSGLEDFRAIVLRNSVIKIASVVLILLLVKKTDDLWKYVLIMAGSVVGGNLCIWPSLGAYVKLCRVPRKSIFMHLRPMLTLFMATLAVSIYTYIDKVMLGAMSTVAQVGYYDNAGKMIDFPVGFITALGAVMLPRLANVFANGDEEKGREYIEKSMKLALPVSYALAFGVAGISGTFSVFFWGKEFAPSGPIMALLSVNIVLISWNDIVRTQYLIPKERDRAYLVAVTAGAVTDVAANACLIPLYGGAGAALGTLLSYIVVCAVQTAAVRKELPVRRYLRASLPFLLFGGVMFAVVRRVEAVLNGSIFVTLLAMIAAGAAVFLSLSLAWVLLTKDDFWLSLLASAKEKVRGALHRKG